jgi:hypothetical protein
VPITTLQILETAIVKTTQRQLEWIQQTGRSDMGRNESAELLAALPCEDWQSSKSYNDRK